MLRSNISPIKRAPVPLAALAQPLEPISRPEPLAAPAPELAALPVVRPEAELATSDPQPAPNQMSALVPLWFFGGFLLLMILYGALSH